MSALDELEKLMKKPAAAADSTEAKVRSQITNRLVLETLYSGALANLQPQKRSGVVYRSDDQGETWKAMTEYKLTGGSTQVNQTEGGYYGRIIIDPNDDKVVYCGDTNTTVSKDSGKTFAVTGWDGTGKTHVDHRVVWVDPLNSNAHPERQRRRRERDVERRQELEPEERHPRPAVLRRGGGPGSALQRDGRHAGQRRVDRAVAEPQQLRDVRGRLEVPADGRRLLRRPRLVEPGVHLLREPVRRVEPPEPEHRRDEPARRAPDARAGGRGRAGAPLPVERAHRPLAAQPRHRLHREPVRVAIAQPGRAGHVPEDQPGPHQGEQGEDRALAEDQPAVGDHLQLRRVAEEARPLLGGHRRRERAGVDRQRQHLDEHHQPVLRRRRQAEGGRQGRPDSRTTAG